MPSDAVDRRPVVLRAGRFLVAVVSDARCSTAEVRSRSRECLEAKHRSGGPCVHAGPSIGPGIATFEAPMVDHGSAGRIHAAPSDRSMTVKS